MFTVEIEKRFFLLRILFLIAVLSLTGCIEQNERAEIRLLQTEQPFGLNWKLDIVGNDKLNLEFVEDGFFRDCTNEDYQPVFLKSNYLPPIFNEGEVSITVSCKGNPAAFEYHYLHRTVMDSTESERKARSKEAIKIRKYLEEIYGPPNFTAEFIQFEEFPLPPASGSEAPCSVWIIDQKAVSLCEQRVVMIDGLEMSLSFYDLERVPFGADLKAMK